MLKLLKEFVPPIFLRLYRRSTMKYGWFGNYASWKEAQRDSTGYDSVMIAEKVKNSLLQVKSGKAAYERDSVLFNKVEYSMPLVAALMWIANQNKNKLNVVDFGGALGSTFFQNQRFLKDLEDVKWSIVEQKVFVEYGRKYFEDEVLTFHLDIETCMAEQKPNVVMFSCVLQYLEDPFKILSSVLNHTPDFIIVDNMPFFEKKKIITLQRVPPQIYSASYPCWILNKSEFLSYFKQQYDLIADFKSGLSINVSTETLPYEGFIFKRKAN